MPGSISQAFKQGVEIPLETLIFENQEKSFMMQNRLTLNMLWIFFGKNIFTQEALTNQDGKSRYDDKEKFGEFLFN